MHIAKAISSISYTTYNLIPGALPGYSPTYSFMFMAWGQDYMGDGGLYTLWMGLMALVCPMVLFMIEKGVLWHK